jgi:hypothetical protein
MVTAHAGLIGNDRPSLGAPRNIVLRLTGRIPIAVYALARARDE